MTPDPLPSSHSLRTRWTLLEQLERTQAGDAWRWFIDRYRPFVRSVLRRVLSQLGREAELAAAVEEFWGYLYGSEVVARADRDRRFRSFLAGTLRNFAREYCRRNPALPAADEGNSQEPSSDLDIPELEELRLFAHQVLHLALELLEQSYPSDAQALRWFYGVDQGELSELRETLSVAEIAGRLEIQANAVHQLLHRARKRLRRCVEQELRETVGSGSDLEAEMREILEALAQDSPGLALR
jgi:RNA polymerase sigma factor (sigma-70 family)